MLRAIMLLLLLYVGLVSPPLAAAAPPPGVAEVEQVTQQARAAMMADPREAERLARSAEARAAALPDANTRTLATATLLWMRAEAFVRMDESDAARPLIERAFAMIAPITAPLKLRADLFMTRGALRMLESRAALALNDYLQGYEIFGKLGERRSQAIALQNIASLYTAANDFQRAERYYRQAAETYGGDPLLSLSLHNNRGNVLLMLERYAEADAEYEAALAIARKQGNGRLEARILVNYARSQVEARDYDAAEQSLARGTALVRDTDAVMLRRQFLATGARVAAERGDMRRAERLIREAFAGVDLTTTSAEFRNAHAIAHQVLTAVGDNLGALRHLEALKRLSDEAAKVATSTNAALMAARFDYANQELRIANLKADELRKSAEYERTLFFGIGGATLVVIVLLTAALLVIRRSRNEVRAANTVLNETNVALEKALKAKTEFLATTSHEIRTPLNGILGMTQVMLADPKVPDTLRDRIGVVHGAGLTMRALVDDILDLAKMETGNLTVDPVPMDLVAVLRDVTRMWEEQASAKGLVFRLDVTQAPQWIVCDPGRLRQIAFNLLSNACKFTERGGVTVRAVAQGEGQAQRLQVQIADTGIGIPSEKCEEIFESFRQADAGTTRRFGGTGLGLTICRNLARALGGDIVVESVEGAGSTFTIDLPLVAAEAPAKAAGPERGLARVIVLDRNPIARSMLRTLLEPRSGVLAFVATIEEAEAALAEGGATHLLADEATLRGLESDALAAVARLSGAARSAGAELVALWPRPDDAVRAALAAAGAGVVVSKPIAGACLIAALAGDEGEISAKGSHARLVSHAA